MGEACNTYGERRYAYWFRWTLERMRQLGRLWFNERIILK